MTNRATIPEPAGAVFRRTARRAPARHDASRFGDAVVAVDLTTCRHAFSLVELVMVVVIIGLISAIAVPRITRGARSAQANSVAASLSSVRTAIDAYHAEHGRYPGYNPANGLPNGIMFVAQLTQYTDAAGRANPEPTGPYKFGPYLRPPFPRNPRNGLDTVHVKPNPAAPGPAAGSVGWVAVLSHGYFGIAATDAELVEMGAETLEAKTNLKAGPQ